MRMNYWKYRLLDERESAFKILVDTVILFSKDLAVIWDAISLCDANPLFQRHLETEFDQVELVQTLRQF